MITEKNIPKCKEIVEDDKKYISKCSHLSYYPLAVKEAKGAILTDEDGHEYIDFLSSASSLNLGSSHPVVTKAIEEQLKKMTQYTPAYTYSKNTVEYAKRLASVFPGGGDVKVCFGNCGSDANDACVKFARAYTGRQKIMVFKNGYHGNTYGSSSMTTVTNRMREGMGPFLPEIYAFTFYGNDMPDDIVERDCMKEIEEICATEVSAKEFAAVVIEPIQGDGGLLPAHPIFMKKLYDWCKKNGVLFFSEEVQQGFYRTGKFFAIEHYDGIIPDGIVMGKSIGAGLTLGAFMARAEIMDVLPAPAHLFTLGGNAIACAAGIAAFDYYQTDEFQNILAENSKVLIEEAKKLQKKYPEIVDFTRSIGGVSMGIGLKAANGASADDLTYKVLYRAYQRGLVVISLCGSILRIQPPLIIEAEQLRKGFEIISKSIDDFLAGDIGDDVFQYRAGW